MSIEETAFERVQDYCEDRFDEEELFEMCVYGAENASGGGRENVAILESEGELDDMDEYDAFQEAYGAFEMSHSGSAKFANTISTQVDAAAEELARKEGASFDKYGQAPSWATNEAYDAYYEGAGQQIREETDITYDKIN